MNATTELPADVAAIVGPVAAHEFANASDHYKPGLIDWARNLPTLSDDEFTNLTASAIYDSALVSRFRGNWDHDHFKASACYTEAKRRHVAAGHDKDCRGATWYSLAHDRVMREQGHRPSPPSPCNCHLADN